MTEQEKKHYAVIMIFGVLVCNPWLEDSGNKIQTVYVIGISCVMICQMF